MDESIAERAARVRAENPYLLRYTRHGGRGSGVGGARTVDQRAHPEPLTQDQELEPAMSRLIVDRTDDRTTITAVQDDGTEQVVMTVTPNPTKRYTLTGRPAWVVEGVDKPWNEARDRWDAEHTAVSGLDLTETIPVASERPEEINVCEDCATHVELAADPDNGHVGGYGSVDPCDECGDGRAGTRKRALRYPALVV